MRSPQRLLVHPCQIRDQQVHLTPEQVHYLCHVLRLKPTDTVCILDGQGHRWHGQLGGDRATVHLLEIRPPSGELKTELILCLALLKAPNFEQVLQQATELGVRQIVPIQTARSLLQPSANKYQRWRRIVQEAAEQSERLYLPTIGQPLTVSEMIQRLPQGYVGSLRSNVLLADYFPTIPWQAPLAVAIGPEGGWTTAELDHMVAAGWQEFSLGSRPLRAVTAAIATLSLLSHACQQQRS